MPLPDDMDDEALKRVVNLGETIANQIAVGGPMAHLLVSAREDAIEAARKLFDVDPEKAAHVRALQNEVMRFRDLAMYVSRAMEAADTARLELTESQNAELDHMLGIKRTPDA